MIRSLRLRILAWYALSLTLTVASFGGFLYWRMRQSRISEMDLELHGAGQTLTAGVKALPEFDFLWDKPLGTVPEYWEMPPPPGGRGGRGPRGPGGPGGRGPDGRSRGGPPPGGPRGGLEERGGPESGELPPELQGLGPEFGGEFGPPSRGDGRGGRGRGGRGPGGPGGPGGQRPSDLFWGPPGGPPDEGPPPGLVEDVKRNNENVALPPNFERSVEFLEKEKPSFAIWRKDGTILKASSANLPQGFQVAQQVNPTPEGVIRSEGPYRELWIAGPRESTIFIRRKAAKVYGDLRQWLWGIVGAGLGVLVVGLAGGWWTSYGVLKSIRSMNAEVSRLSEENLSQRIGLKGVDEELTVLADTLNRTFARLEAAFDRQRQFTGDASHELRTPLTVVMGNLELALENKNLDANARHSLEAALRAARRMRGLTDQLLMLARADAGAIELKRSEFDLGDIVQECAELIRPMAEKKQVRLVVDAPSTEMEGDAGLLSQVVMNLLSNAIQYNKPGGDVRVGIRDLGEQVQLQVADTGVGIPEEARARLFERFYRVDSSRNRQSGGNGLGLAISKSLVEAHGGRITFESVVGNGAEFRVLLPRC